MKKLGKKRNFDRLTLDAFGPKCGCGNYICTCTCANTCSSCSWVLTAFIHFSNDYNVFASTQATPQTQSYTMAMNANAALNSHNIF